jgi:hypothetical protein
VKLSLLLALVVANGLLPMAKGLELPPLPRSWLKPNTTRGATKLMQKSAAKSAGAPKTLTLTWDAPTNTPWGIWVAWDAQAQRDVTNYYEIQRRGSLAGAWAVVGVTNRPPITVSANGGAGYFRYRMFQQ